MEFGIAGMISDLVRHFLTLKEGDWSLTRVTTKTCFGSDIWAFGCTLYLYMKSACMSSVSFFQLFGRCFFLVHFVSCSPLDASRASFNDLGGYYNIVIFDRIGIQTILCCLGCVYLRVFSMYSVFILVYIFICSV
jgi:hypothetical protein